MLPGSLALLGDANFGMFVPIPTYHRVLGPLLSKEGYDCHFTKISCHVAPGKGEAL